MIKVTSLRMRNFKVGLLFLCVLASSSAISILSSIFNAGTALAPTAQNSVGLLQNVASTYLDTTYSIFGPNKAIPNAGGAAEAGGLLS